MRSPSGALACWSATRLGWKAYEIAFELRISERTVQRYRDNERAGRPPGNPPIQRRTLERAPQIRRLAEMGYGNCQIADKIGMSPRTVRRYLAMAS